MISELSTDMGSAGDNIAKHINQTRDEIILAIKRHLTNAETTATQAEDILGKLCSLLLYVITIINNYMYVVSRR